VSGLVGPGAAGRPDPSRDRERWPEGTR
jgi:hypothetical protein